MPRRQRRAGATYAILLLGGLTGTSYATRYKKDAQIPASFNQPIQISGEVSHGFMNDTELVLTPTDDSE
jgi:hypothetical protein